VITCGVGVITPGVGDIVDGVACTGPLFKL
jgi:hypothetical protein